VNLRTKISWWRHLVLPNIFLVFVPAIFAPLVGSEDPTDGALIISGILSVLAALLLCFASAWGGIVSPGVDAFALMVTVFFAACS
jgi:hypothetical protein